MPPWMGFDYLFLLFFIIKVYSLNDHAMDGYFFDIYFTFFSSSLHHSGGYPDGKSVLLQQLP
jgi:hypothetical protein